MGKYICKNNVSINNGSIVEAIQYDGQNLKSINDFVGNKLVLEYDSNGNDLNYVKTFQGNMLLYLAAYIIKFKDGKIYLCDSYNFNKDFEEIDDAVKVEKIYSNVTVTKEQVMENMKDVICRTAMEFDKPVTYVTVRMINGFTLRESTTCVDPSNYDEEIGKQICLEKIEDKIWFLLGYALQDSLFKNK